MAVDRSVQGWIVWAGCFIGFGFLPCGGWAQSPLAKLRTPRETVKTLYFSIIAYDFHPALIDDAIACLEKNPEQARTAGELSRLAIELDAILQELCLPLDAVLENPSGDRVVLYDADGFTIALRRQADNCWLFDRDTVDRIPTMYRLALLRHRNLQAERASLREGFTDPSATLRRFLVDGMAGDYYAATQALDLSKLPSEQRERAPTFAQQLLFVIQRRGWVFFQEVPNQPDGPPFTWHADRDGRIVLERVRLPDGKDAWLFSRNTVRNLGQMYEAARNKEPDAHYVQLRRVVPPVASDPLPSGTQCPPSIPPQLGTPRAVLKGFFAAMDDAERDDSRLVDAIACLDLEAMPAADRPMAGAKLAAKLDTVLRKLEVDLDAIPDSWNAPPQVLGKGRGMRVELVRLRDGTWRFSRATVDQIPQLFDQLAVQEQADRKRTGHLESARDTMVSFLTAGNHHDDERAARCLDLSGVNPSARAEAGSVLAFKLRYVIDRTRAVYPQEVPDEPEGPRYLFSSSALGRIVIARKNDGPNAGKWFFTAETVERIEPMFLAIMDKPVDESLRSATAMVRQVEVWDVPGVWLRLRMPEWARISAGSLELYQWIGLVLTLLLSWAVAKLSLNSLENVGVWVLRRSGSALTAPYVAGKLRPLTWVATCWLFFKFPAWLDLPVAWLHTILPARTFLMAGLIGWLGFQLIDLMMAIYMNSELLRPHRSLGDMIVPVSMRLFKGIVFLLVLGYVIYHVGHGESLIRFLTGLGMAGLAASLAAQDILKSVFGTMLLIGERSFKLGDRIKVDGHDGVVEQVGFRSTRMRTPDGSLVTIPNSTITSSSILRIVPDGPTIDATELRRAS
ncbi:MAG TPA: mechanosensitive ion channel domain-containing protein [Gemmataceae bacterium]|nr:mechanosensitive ion channel domain-containing protein [Gemmataceae bacterium]